jgi:riboflavin synthase
MFSGIVESVGIVRHVEQHDGGCHVIIASGNVDLADVHVGDSIAVDGCCLTVVQLEPDAFHVDVSAQTLAATIGLAHGAAVNLEKSLRLSDRLGGHLVTGHVDGRGEVTRMEPAGENWLLAIRVPAELQKFVARKGSITVNGVSLTINEVESSEFRVNLIPHTLHATNLRHLRVGSQVNLEVDLVARYVQRLLEQSV